VGEEFRKGGVRWGGNEDGMQIPDEWVGDKLKKNDHDNTILGERGVGGEAARAGLYKGTYKDHHVSSVRASNTIIIKSE